MNRQFITNPSEQMTEKIAKWFGFLATDPIRLDIDEFHHLVSNSYNVILVEGLAKDEGRMEKAIEMAEKEASSIAPNFDFFSADRYLIQICYNQDVPLMVDELAAVQRLMSSFPKNADVAWGLSKQESDNRIRIRVAATNIKRM